MRDKFANSSLIWSLLAVLFAYISFVPYYYFQPQSIAQEIPRFSIIKYGPFFIAIMAICLWFINWRISKRNLVLTVVDWSIAAYLGLSLISLLNAEYLMTGLSKWTYYNTTGVALYFIVVQLGSSWEEQKRFGLFMAIVGAVAASYTILFSVVAIEPFWDAIQRQYNPYHTSQRAMGPFGHTVATATYSIWLLPLVGWAAIGAKRRWSRAMWALACVGCVVVVFLTQTRGAQLAVLLCGLVMLPVFIRKARDVMRGAQWRKNTLAIAVVGLLVAAVSWEIFITAETGTVSSAVRQRWHEVLDSRKVEIREGDRIYRYDSLLEYTERYRIAQYYTVYNILLEHPFFGVGFGNFSRQFERYRYSENYILREFAEHTTENMYLMFIAEIGILGLLSRLAIMLSILIYIAKSWSKMSDGSRKNLLWLYLASFAGISFNMLTWDLLNEPTIRMAYWLWTGLAVAVARHQGQGN